MKLDKSLEKSFPEGIPLEDATQMLSECIDSLTLQTGLRILKVVDRWEFSDGFGANCVLSSGGGLLDIVWFVNVGGDLVEDKVKTNAVLIPFTQGQRLDRLRDSQCWSYLWGHYTSSGWELEWVLDANYEFDFVQSVEPR